MIARSKFPIFLAIAALAVPVALATPASAKGNKIISMIDTDNDDTIDLKEVQAVASAKFDALEGDKDGTLDAKELKGRGGKKVIAEADPDKDGTLDKKEYLALVESRFKAADPDNDGTLRCRRAEDPGRQGLGEAAQVSTRLTLATSREPSLTASIERPDPMHRLEPAHGVFVLPFRNRRQLGPSAAGTIPSGHRPGTTKRPKRVEHLCYRRITRRFRAYRGRLTLPELPESKETGCEKAQPSSAERAEMHEFLCAAAP